MRAITAMDPYRVIGNHGKIPWHFPEDFKHFKKMTTGEVLVMGRTTFESIGKPLPHRFTYVLTNDPKKLSIQKQVDAAVNGKQGLTHSYITGDMLKEMLVKYPGRTSYFWLCGGAKVYKEFLPFCSEIFVTHIMDDYEGDVYMSEFEHMFPHSEILRETKDFWIVRYAQHEKLPNILL